MPTRDLVLLITAAFGLTLLPGFIARFFPALPRTPKAVPSRRDQPPPPAPTSGGTGPTSIRA